MHPPNGRERVRRQLREGPAAHPYRSNALHLFATPLWRLPGASLESIAIWARAMCAEDLALKSQRCLEVLAEQLTKGEARAWAQAVDAREPFELSIWSESGGRLADTYVPTGRAYGGKSVYRGITGGLLAYACVPAKLGPIWAFSSEKTDEVRSGQVYYSAEV